MTKETKVAIIEKKLTPLASEAESMTVTSPSSLAKATVLLSQLNLANDKITEEKEKITKPLNEALKVERARWKPFEDICKKGIDHLRSAISIYQTALVKKQEADERAIADRIKPGKGNLSLETAAKKMDQLEKPQDKVETSSGSLAFRKTTILKVTSLALIPRDYLIPNEPRLLEALRAGQSIPGVELDIVLVPVNQR